MNAKIHNISTRVEQSFCKYYDDQCVKCSYSIANHQGLQKFYKTLYRERRNYLLDSTLAENANQPCRYYYVEMNGDVVAAARFSGAPFESHAYFRNNEFNNNYVEICRLGMSESARRYLAATLVVIFGVKEMSALGAEGVYALVRLEDSELYLRYGLEPCSQEIVIRERAFGRYVVVSAPCERLIESTENVVNRVAKLQTKVSKRQIYIAG